MEQYFVPLHFKIHKIGGKTNQALSAHVFLLRIIYIRL